MSKSKHGADTYPPMELNEFIRDLNIDMLQDWQRPIIDYVQRFKRENQGKMLVSELSGKPVLVYFGWDASGGFDDMEVYGVYVAYPDPDKGLEYVMEVGVHITRPKFNGTEPSAMIIDDYATYSSKLFNSNGTRKEPKKKLPYYHQKRRF